MFVGPTGTGKSKYISNKLLNGIDADKYVPVFISFSARTSANQTQDIISAKLDKRRKGVYGPPLGKKCLIFVDDLNMPAKEIYGAQPPIELLRQWMDHGNWYDRKDTSKIDIVDIQFLAAMGPPGGGRNLITPRFLRHFNQIAIDSFEDETMQQIFSSIMEWHFQRSKDFSTAIRSLGNSLVAATMRVHKEALQNLLPTPAKTHYTFNLRDFSRVIQGLTLSSPAVYRSSSSMIRLWIHEIYRVYYDRLVAEEDRLWLFSCLKDTAKDCLQVELQDLLAHLLPQGCSTLAEEHIRYLMFGDFIPTATIRQQKIETGITDETTLPDLKVFLAHLSHLSNPPPYRDESTPSSLTLLRSRISASQNSASTTASARPR